MFHGQLKNTQFIFNSLLSESFIYYLVLCANIYIYKKRVPGFINNKWNKIFFTWFCFLIKNAFEPQTCRWQTEVYSPAPAPSSLCSPSFISLCVKRCIIQFAGQLWLLFKRLETVHQQCEAHTDEILKTAQGSVCIIFPSIPWRLSLPRSQLVAGYQFGFANGGITQRAGVTSTTDLQKTWSAEVSSGSVMYSRGEVAG